MTETKARNVMAALREVACEDLLSMTSEDFLREAQESGVDVEAVASCVKSGMLEALAAARREKLSIARQHINNTADRKHPMIVHPPLDQIKSILQSLYASNRKVQLAFREGKRQTDTDLISLYDDLVRMGVINENGTPH